MDEKALNHNFCPLYTDRYAHCSYHLLGNGVPAKANTISTIIWSIHWLGSLINEFVINVLDVKSPRNTHFADNNALLFVFMQNRRRST